MELVHGTGERDRDIEVGFCLTDSERAATEYARQHDERWVRFFDLDLDGLTVVEVDGYDVVSNWAPGDRDEDHAADVIVFDGDQSPITCETHRTWRLMTPAAVAALTEYQPEEL